eukprot:Skav221915  [mRNA]  locus=scaffold3084:93548:96701:+ [translate_table: standard]
MLKRKRPGYYSGCCSQSKWPLAREKYKWDKFVELLPHQATKRDEVPMWLRARLCEDSKPKGPRREVIPNELIQILDAILLDEIARGLEMCKQSVTCLLLSLIDLYNQEAESFNKTSEKDHLEKAMEMEQSGHLSKEELQAFVGSPPKQVQLISKDLTSKRLEHFVDRFCRTYGYSLYRQDRPSKHLSREHPSMKSLQDFIQTLKTEKKIMPRLMFNWDQVPAGFGAVLQPNDQFHQFFHLIRSGYLRAACGVASNPLTSDLLNKELGPQNVPIISCPLKTSLAADVFALNKIREYRQGTLVQWAWVVTGHVTEEELTEWRYGGDRSLLEESMAACKGGIKELLHMSEVPPVNHEVQGCKRIHFHFTQNGMYTLKRFHTIYCLMRKHVCIYIEIYTHIYIYVYWPVCI